MNLEFSDKFSKDIEKINSKAVKASVIELIEKVESAENLKELTGIKNL